MPEHVTYDRHVGLSHLHSVSPTSAGPTPPRGYAALDGVDGFRFVHVPITAFSSDSPNIPLTAAQIRDRFMSAL